jgi:hypothetical protein
VVVGEKEERASSMWLFSGSTAARAEPSRRAKIARFFILLAN